MATSLLDLVDQESQKHEQRQDRRQILRAVPVVMLEMIALILERIEGFVLDLPARAPGEHDAFDRARRQRQVSNPRPAGYFSFFIGLLVEQVVDGHINRAVRQTEVIGPGKEVLQALLIGQPQFFNLPARPASGKLLLQAFVRVRFDVQDVVPVVTDNLPNVRRVGIERVFHQDDFQVGVTLVEGRAELFAALRSQSFFCAPSLLRIGSKSSGKTSLCFGWAMTAANPAW